jgi:hypothetical protein
MKPSPRSLTATVVALLAAALTMSGAARGAAVFVCVGDAGHVEVESRLAGCCGSARSEARGEGVEAALPSPACGDCTDVQLDEPALTSEGTRLHRPGLVAASAVSPPIAGAGLSVRAAIAADMDRHWQTLTPLSTVVLLT